jgi:hypothetical protein
MTNNLTSDSTVNATASSATPAWVGGLSTASIRADMTAADVNGTVTYSGLEKVFADVAGTLSASNASVTAGEMSDLETIADNLNNGMSTSSYLAYITNALVDGNAANTKWTGGAAHATALGDLTVGSSATQLSELVGKWFEGTDLPKSAIDIEHSKYGTNTVTYSPSDNPLFGPSGPQVQDVNQGHIGDCYFLASLAEVTNQTPGTISSMFTDNGNGTYGVRFYHDGVAEYVTVNDELPGGGYTNRANGANQDNTGAIWASLAEKAYAQLQGGGDVTGTNHDFGNSYSTIGNTGKSRYALEEVTGASSITEYDADKETKTWTANDYNSSLDKIGSSSGLSTKNVLEALISDLANGDDLLVSSHKSDTDIYGNTTLVKDHVLSIIGYGSTKNELEIRNPWGTRGDNQTFDTTFTVGLSTLLSDGDSITVAHVGNSVSQLAQAMAAFSPPAAGTAGSPVQSDVASTLSHVLASPVH